MEFYRYILYLLFGILPSLIWLGYYLRKDLHPEPKRMIAKVFLLGAITTGPILFLQLGLLQLAKQEPLASFFSAHPLLQQIATWFAIIAVTEETAKYLVVKFSVLKSRELDEPLDLMLYMVVAALGFAATENTLYLFAPVGALPFDLILEKAVIISFIRFIGATFLHTLCSALVGYFLVRGAIRPSRAALFTVSGILLAVLLHGLYDFSIMTLTGPANLVIPALVIFLLAVFVMYDFDEVKKWKGICKI